MLAGLNQKTLGAIVVGIALVAGAYTISRFGEPRLQYAAVANPAAPARVTIAVTDQDNNGIEDWRDDFVTTQAVLPSASSTLPYVPPSTLTGQLGIQFMENILLSKSYGEYGKPKEEIIADTITTITEETEQRLYGTGDIIIMETWTDADIKNYANAMAGAVLNNDVAGVDSELNILNEALNRDKPERIQELQTIVDIYRSTKEDSLAIPVPRQFSKQHLDLINSYTALEGDVVGMMLSLEDPLIALARIKRYKDDSLGLRLSLENMYRGLEPHSALFSSGDSALFFANYNSQSNLQ